METLKETFIQNINTTIIDKDTEEIVIRQRYNIEFSFKIGLKVEVTAEV